METKVSFSFTNSQKRLRNGSLHLASQVTRSVLGITHNGFALLGVGLVFGVVLMYAQPQWRISIETGLISWLESRQDSGRELSGVDQTLSQVSKLPKPQAALASWLSKKYRVAPEPLSALVAEAFELGSRVKLEPTLILAIMAVESGFNPFAQSPVGAQGLMQVMTRAHRDKYQDFGGKLAAFDPVANLRVGVRVLQECIARAGGSLEGGLKFYVGAANRQDDGGYTEKVLNEHNRLRAIAGMRSAVTAVAPGSQKVAFSQF